MKKLLSQIEGMSTIRQFLWVILYSLDLTTEDTFLRDFYIMTLVEMASKFNAYPLWN